MNSYSVSFVIDAETDDEAYAVVALMKEAGEQFCFVSLSDISYTYAGTPIAKPITDQYLYDVVLTDAGQTKIQLIKEIRSVVSGIGLREAKDLVDHTTIGYVTLLSDLDEGEAERAVRALEMAGATAHIERTRLTVKEIDAAKRGLTRIYEELSDGNRDG